MSQEFIDRLYNIAYSGSTEEFKNNINFFNEFCHNLSSIRNFDEKSFAIIKVILNNQELMENEYLVSNILDTLKYTQERICWQISQSKENSIDDLDVVLNELNKYKDIKTLVTNPNYAVNNSINQSSINQYSNSQIYIYYVDSLMKILSTNYLTISKDKSDEIMNLIYNDGWLNDLLTGKIQNSMLNRDLIDKYIQRVLSIKEFVSPESISDDKLVKAIINYNIKDPKLINNLISYLSPSKLMNIFDNKMDNLINFIVNADYMDEQYKGSLIANIVNKYSNEDNYEYLLDLLQTEVMNNPLVSKMINDKSKEMIINFAKNDSIKDWKSVYYLLDSGVLDKNFISNAMSLNGARKGKVKLKALEAGILEENDYDIKIDVLESDESKLSKMEKYNLTGQIVDYNIAMDLLKKYFNGQVQLSMEATKAIVRSITIEELSKNGLENVGVLFDNLQKVNGSFNETDRGNYISISMSQIEKMLDSNAKLEDRLDIFITMFHEMRHAQKHNNIYNNQFDYNSYFMLKELIIEEYDSNYYSSNYRLILEEIDARQDSYETTLNFFKKNFPELENAVSNVVQKQNENYDYAEYNEKKFTITNKKEFVNQIFDKIISLHPELLEEYPVLQLEYNLDGNIKKIDEINVQENYAPVLLNQIIEKRFGKTVYQQVSNLSDARMQIMSQTPYPIFGLEKVSDKDFQTILLHFNNSTQKEPLRMYECIFLTLKNNPQYDDITEKTAQLFEILAEEKRVETSYVSLWGQKYNQTDSDVVEINEIPHRIVKTSKPYHTLGNYSITLSDIYSYRISKGTDKIPETLDLKINSPTVVEIKKYETLSKDLATVGMTLPKNNNSVVDKAAALITQTEKENQAVYEALKFTISDKINGILSNVRYTHLNSLSDPIVEKKLRDLTQLLTKGSSVYDIESAELRLSEVTSAVEGIIDLYNKEQEKEKAKEEIRKKNQEKIQALQELKQEALEHHTYNPLYTDEELKEMHPEEIDDRDLLKQALTELDNFSQDESVVSGKSR